MHSRQSSSSSLPVKRSNSLGLQDSYVQRLRMAKATVWAERGPKDSVNDVRKAKVSSSQKRGRFGGMKVCCRDFDGLGIG